MCGISGIFSYKQFKNTYPIDSYLNYMNQKQVHRGPDDQGIAVLNQGNVGLAHTRLSILDLSPLGHQPMVDEQTGNIITFNGEIFNYLDIKKEYLKYELFESTSDTEVLLRLFRKDKLKMFKYLNGMYAIGLWDEKDKSIVLARDPSGKKPLYYSEMGGKFVFASELKAILSLPCIKRELDENALYDFLTYKCVPPPATMFKNIYKFLPGYYMIVDDNGIRSYEPFYKLKRQSLQFSSEEDIADTIFAKLKKSVKQRMISDVPVGAFLSGGVDSSAIVALMRENTKKEIKTFTIGFENQPDFNEIQYSAKIANMFNTTHFEKIVRPNDLIELISTIVSIYDEPNADTTAIPIYFISKLANEQNIKVVLNGDGPDELFAGYNSFLKYARVYPYFKIIRKSPKIIKTIVTAILQHIDAHSAAYEISHRLKNGQILFWPGASGVKEGFKQKILSPNFRKQFNDYNSYSYVLRLQKEYFEYIGFEQENDIIDWMSYAGFRHSDTENFLFRADRLGMANSIEARSPFLNIDMVEFALSIPSSLKIKNNTPKHILKKSLEKILPTSVLYRKKMGFCLPIQQWAGGYITNYIIDNIDNFTANIDYFSKKTIINGTNDLKNGKTNNTNFVWTIYFLMNWFKQWM